MKLNTRHILYGISLTAIMLTCGLSSQAQDIKFSDTPYGTLLFSATFPVGTKVEYEQTKDKLYDENEYSAYSSVKDTTDSFFKVSYTEYLTKTITDGDVEVTMGHHDDAEVVTKGPTTNSTLGGLSARKASNTIKSSLLDTLEREYIIVAGSGSRRMWIAYVRCNKCTQADADKFFDSIKISR